MSHTKNHLIDQMNKVAAKPRRKRLTAGQYCYYLVFWVLPAMVLYLALLFYVTPLQALVIVVVLAALIAVAFIIGIICAAYKATKEDMYR